jgi:hypothetical protein
LGQGGLKINRYKLEEAVLGMVLGLLDPDPLVRDTDPDRVGIKKPTQKNPPKKTHLKKPTKNGFFWVFLNFLFFMK